MLQRLCPGNNGRRSRWLLGRLFFAVVVVAIVEGCAGSTGWCISDALDMDTPDLEGFEGASDGDRKSEMLWRLKSDYTGCLIAGVLLWQRYRYEEHEEVVRRLLEFPDIAVRRVVAEVLFPRDYQRKETVRRYKYLEALQAEKEIERLAEIIRSGRLREQALATDELIALGRPAYWGLWVLRRKEEDNQVGLSAFYALDRVRFIPSQRREEMTAKLRETKVNFKRQPLSGWQWMLVLGQYVPIQFCQSVSELGEETLGRKFAMRAAEVPLHKCLSVVCDYYGMDWYVRRGHVVLYAFRFVSAARPMLVDVRDLEAQGVRLDWTELVRDKISDSLEYGDDPSYFSGFLDLFVRCPAHDPAGVKGVKPLLDFLDDLRKENGLPEREQWFRGLAATPKQFY